MERVRDVRFNRNSLLTDYFRMVILGGSGSGKTTFLLSLFKTLVSKYNHIYLYTPLLNPSYDYYIWPDHLFKIENTDQLDLYLSKMKYKLENIDTSSKHEFLLILDDIGDMQLKSKLLPTMVNVGRHMKVSIIMLCQTYRHVPTTCRCSITHLCCCNVSDADIENITRSMSLLDTKNMVRALTVMRSASKGKKVFILENTVFAKSIRICYDTADQSVIDKKQDTYILLSQYSYMKSKLSDIIEEEIAKKEQINTNAKILNDILTAKSNQSFKELEQPKSYEVVETSKARIRSSSDKLEPSISSKSDPKRVCSVERRYFKRGVHSKAKNYINTMEDEQYDSSDEGRQDSFQEPINDRHSTVVALVNDGIPADDMARAIHPLKKNTSTIVFDDLAC